MSTMRFLLPVVLLAAAAPLPAQQLEVGLVPDGITLAVGGGLALASELVDIPIAQDRIGVEQVNAFDRLAVFPYAKGWDVASDILQFSTAAIPLALGLFMDLDQAGAAGIVYLETLSLAVLSKNCLKLVFPRERPWLSFVAASGMPADAPDERYDSFPSGHTTIAFASAAFGITTFAICFSGSAWLAPFAAVEAAMACATGASRVLAGMHYMSDVIAGGLLGTAIGIGLPLLHEARAASSGGKSVPSLSLEMTVLSVAM